MHATLLLENVKGKHLVGEPRRSSEHDIKMDLKELGYEGVCCIQLAQDGFR